MLLNDLAFTGLGAIVAAGRAARDGFNTLSRRGEAVTPGNGTLAGTVDRLVTHDVPSAIGYALGAAVDGTVRSVECARGAIRAAPAVADRAVIGLLGYMGVPSARDVSELRLRLDRLSNRLDALASRTRAEPAPPWEEAPDDRPVQD